MLLYFRSFRPTTGKRNLEMKMLIVTALFVASFSTSAAFAGDRQDCNGPRSNDHFYCARETGDTAPRDSNGNGSFDKAEREAGRDRNNGIR
ncbi:hypothetical protein P106B_66 [Rhizobium phage vB_RglS_P106B]|uniref:Uncharacterized protein n=1 Tax=Rhizobium phage vB_RglS_P106B TaxID=1458697 RepID=W6E8N9_9CAUD|nr:hypothetical protein P106B_66 [Rhizobium phage vB_RglS_P106B]AHJ10749.1 hypothetical protein P106B_66 [Rhizobium phage vB_RglS_P106B]